MAELTGDTTVGGAAVVVTNDSRLTDARTPTTHTHTKTDVTDFTHTHTKSEVTDFTHTHVKTDVTDFTHTHAMADITDLSTHTHDDRYYTESEMTTALAAKADTTSLTGHTGNTSVHVTTDDKTAWNGKADGTHTHTLTGITDFSTHSDDYTAHLVQSTFTLYVDGTSGDDAHDGLTAVTAKKTIQAAVDAISLLVVAPVIIDIAAGTYTEAVVIKSLALESIAFTGKKDGSNVPTVILDGTSLGASKSGITASFSMTKVYITDIKAQNYTTAGFEAAYGIYMSVTNGHMYNNGLEGFRVYHATGSLNYCLVDGNSVTGAFGAIAFHSYMSITNTEIKNTASYGGYYANHSDGHFDTNNVHDCFCGLAAKIGSFAQTQGTTFNTCTTGIFYDTGSDALWDEATTTFTSCTQNVDSNNIYRFMLGTTAQRPTLGTGTVAGQTFFDITVDKPLWVNKTNDGWVDGAGTTLSASTPTTDFWFKVI